MTTTPARAADPAAASHVVRIEVRPKPGEPDPLAASVHQQATEALGHVTVIRTARVYLIEADLDDQAVARIAHELLADPVSQIPVIGAGDRPEDGAVIEVHYQPGVMDPLAQSTRDAIVQMLPGLQRDGVEVRTGFRYDLHGTDASSQALRAFAQTALANPVIHDIHLQPFRPGKFPRESSYVLHVTQAPIRDLDDQGLMKLSREGHLFLSLDEMRAIQTYYRSVAREPTDVELETLAQTWSEHCVHKTLKATIHYREHQSEIRNRKSQINWSTRPGHTVNDDGSITIHNLLKSTIVAATDRLMQEDHFRQWCVSVFVDNAGIVKFDDEDAVCIKVETHNHPSAIEPYGGAATGIGGCIRDVMGTGLSARPIANTDVFCVALPDTDDVPTGVLRPRRILEQVVAGVRDYGNRMGVPTVNGAVCFHDGYRANPLVFVGCVGLMPIDKCFGDPQPGDRIIALGGRTGRDGIHGATFSSAALTGTHADEFAHAVQIGNAITQKKTMDVILQARDHDGGPLFGAITDCGAGGFSSAVGEMGDKLGARVTLETAPLKYRGLSYSEIWISEAQERMVLAVPPNQVGRLRALCDAEDVEMCDLGHFGQTNDAGEPELVLTYKGAKVGRLSMALLHHGIPTPTREAIGSVPKAVSEPGKEADQQTRTLADILTALLSHPNIASKHWIIRQYDHEVQGGSVVKPLVGPHQDGPSDAAVLRPKLSSDRGIAIACGLQPALADPALAEDADAYWMALAAIDEAVRNCVCCGADPTRIALLDNFCWPGCDDPYQLGALVRAAEACYDGALAYRTPFVSGKDSLNNQFTTDDGRLIAIPPTLLITALGIVADVTRCPTMDAKAGGNLLLIVGQTTGELGGSHYLMIGGRTDNRCIPKVDLQQGPACARAVAQLIAQGSVRSAHDCSDGGLLVAAAEMAFAGHIGLDLDLQDLPTHGELDTVTACFSETPSRYLLEVAPTDLEAVIHTLQQAGVPFGRVGRFADHDCLTLRTPRDDLTLNLALDDLRRAWLQPLDW